MHRRFTIQCKRVADVIATSFFFFLLLFPLENQTNFVTPAATNTSPIKSKAASVSLTTQCHSRTDGNDNYVYVRMALRAIGRRPFISSLIIEEEN